MTTQSCRCAERTGIVKPDLGVVGADAASEGGGDAPLLCPHLHLFQLLAQQPRPPCLRAQKLYQLPAGKQGISLVRGDVPFRLELSHAWKSAREEEGG